ncbi:cytochrome P450 4c3-like [Anticarsia gemmatalis]|uniref:cytochrome P450 4c3-like n=1 Tax=Anticarsia gemmatalis TaxID=129554 RepID=UPI003F76D5F3
MFLLFIYLLCTLILVLHVYFRYSYAGRLMAKIPGPKGHPFLGNYFDMCTSPELLFDALRVWRSTYGKIYKLCGFYYRTVHVFNPEDIEILLSSVRYNKKDMPYTFLYGWLGGGLLVSNGEKWMQRRKLLTPAFHFNILTKFFKTFREHTQNLLEDINEEVGKDKTDVTSLINKVTLQIMCETSMGATVPNEKSLTKNYLKYSHEISLCLLNRMCMPIYFLNILYMLTPHFRKERGYLPDLHNFSKQLINTRREIRQQNNVGEEISDKKKRPIMLDILLDEEKKGRIDEAGIREEVDTFLFEGYDTTATALVFMIIRLANEPQVQDLIFKELQDIYDDTRRETTMEDFNKMKYLECCIKESLRLYSSVPFISRYVTEELTIAGYKIPKNTYYDVHIYDVHRNPEIYPEPEKFIPERFLPENAATRHPYAYIPFSAGPRNCIGQKFAILEIKSLLSGLLRKFYLQPVTKTEDLRFYADMILRVNHPLYVRFCRREQPLKLFYAWREWSKTYSRIFKLCGGHYRTINVQHPEDAEILLSSVRHSGKDMPYTFFKNWLGDGLLLSNGDKWMQRRKLLTPALHFNILTNFFRTFSYLTENFVNDVQKEVGKDKTDMISLIQQYSLQAMCETSMGTKISNEALLTKKYLKSSHEISPCFVKRLSVPLYISNVIYKLTTCYGTEKSHLPHLHDFTKQLINNRREMRKQNNIIEETIDKKKRSIMLDILLDEEKKGRIDEAGIREEVDTFLFEGYDTTATALIFMMICLANEPKVQNAIYEELQSIYGDTKKETTIEDLNKMKYLECCIKESLRLYPSVPFICRYVTEELTVAGYRIPKNTYYNILITDMHRNPEIYPEPEKFIPERFLPENSATRHPYAYIPFSAGPRNCIGQKFALMEMKTLMSGLLREYHLEPVTKVKDLTFTADIILRVNHPLFVRICKRERPC